MRNRVGNETKIYTVRIMTSGFRYDDMRQDRRLGKPGQEQRTAHFPYLSKFTDIERQQLWSVVGGPTGLESIHDIRGTGMEVGEGYSLATVCGWNEGPIAFCDRCG